MTVSDDELIELLGRALQAAEPLPDRVVTGARAAWTWRTIDQELAELVFDSATELTGVRSEDTARQLTFRAPGVEIEVMVADAAARRVVGQLIPPGPYTVQLISGDQELAQESDHLGRFTFEPVPPGPVRLTVHSTDGDHVATTEWVLF
jgi:hypothetical protein